MDAEEGGPIERATTLLPAIRTALAAVTAAATKEEAQLAVRQDLCRSLPLSAHT